MKTISLSLILGLFLAAWAAAAPLSDGPYIDRINTGQWRASWVEGDESAPRVREQFVAVGETFTVPGVGSLPAFDVKLRKPDKVAPDAVKLPRGRPLFVVADIHGEFDILIELLRAHGIVDRNLKWSYGRNSVAFLGDIFDRGANQTEVLWLIYKLEGEAREAGGRVFMTLGNHESMVMLGDMRYLADKYPKVAKAIGFTSYARLWSKNTFLGQWLRTKPVVMKLGDFLCMHGGISPELTGRNLPLKTINAAARDVLNFTTLQDAPGTKVSLRKLPLMNEKPGVTDADREQAAFIVTGDNGPLWYRGYFSAPEKGGATDEDVSKMLAHFDVNNILVGHTTVPTVQALYGGKVIAVQVYPMRDEKTHLAVMEAAVFKEGKWHKAKIDGTTEVLVPEQSKS